MLNAICYVNGNLDDGDDTIRGMRVEDDDYKILVSQQKVMKMMTRVNCDDDGHNKHKVMIRQMTMMTI